VNFEVHQMLHRAGVQSMDSVVDQYFPKGNVHGHSSHLNKSFFLSDPGTLHRIREMYQDDYKVIETIKRKHSTS